MRTRVPVGGVALVLSLTMACGGNGCRRSLGSPAAAAVTPGTQPTLEELRQPLAKARQELLAALVVSKDAGDFSVSDIVDWMGKAFTEAETADRSLARDSFDVAAVAKSIGPDSRRILEWVRDNTYLVPYRGVLRGPTGVLMDRLGNSLDRALLLAGLLSASGATVRLANATLSPEQAAAMMRRARPMPRHRFDAAGPGSGAPAKDAIVSYAEANRVSPVRLRSAVEGVAMESETLIRRLGQRVQSQLSGIEGMFDKSMTSATARSGADLESVRQHWWVQSQEGAEWIDLDPTFPDAEPGKQAAVATETMALTNVPSDLYHELRIRIVVERWSAGGFTESGVLDHALRPFELFGQRIVLRHRLLEWPNNLKLTGGLSETELHKALLTQKEWLPVLSIGAQDIAQFSFGKSGQVNERPGTQHERPAGGAGAGMLDAFGGGSDPSTASNERLTAEWVEYEIRTPGKAPEKIRRSVFDLVGPAARSGNRILPLDNTETADLQRAMALMGQTDILPLVCRISNEFAEHVMNTNLASQRETVEAILHASEQGNSARLVELSGKLDPVPGQLYGLALVRYAVSQFADDTYLDRLNLVNYHRRIRPNGTEGLIQSNSLDIVANEVAVRPNVEPFRVRMAQGIADTTAENLLVGGCSACSPPANVSEIWVASQRQSTQWQPVRSLEQLAGQSLTLTEDVRRRIEQDLNAGYTVLVPTRRISIGGRDLLGWWRVNPTSGTALGIMESGEGQAMVEYVKQKAALVGTVIFLGSFLDCLGSDGKGLVKAAACLGCGATAGEGMFFFFANAGKAWVVNMTPALAGKLFAVAAVCIIAGLM
jgi:hypothetical protein